MLDKVVKFENEHAIRQIESQVSSEAKPFNIEEPYNPATDDKTKTEISETESNKTKVILDAKGFFGEKGSNEVDNAFSKLFPKLSAKLEAEESTASKQKTGQKPAKVNETVSKIVSDRNANESEIKETKTDKPKKSKKVEVPQPKQEEEQPMSLFKQRMLERRQNM
jgi:hypothetical protein